MQHSIFSLLPDEIIRDILVYDRRFIWRENKMICISRFSKEDERYCLLKKYRENGIYLKIHGVLFCV